MQAFSTGASHPVCGFPSQPARLSLAGRRRADLPGWQSSSGFLCLVSRSPWLQMNCTEPAFLFIPFPSSAEGKTRGRGCWLSGRAGNGEVGAGTTAVVGSVAPWGSAGGTYSRRGSVLGDLVEVPPRPQHPQPDLCSVLRRIERLLQVEDRVQAAIARCLLQSTGRHTADVCKKDELRFFIFVFLILATCAILFWKVTKDWFYFK